MGLPLACDKGTKPEAGAASASAAVSASAPLVDFEAPLPPASAASSAAPAPSGSAAGAAEKPKPVQRRGLVGELFTRAQRLDLSDEQKSKLDAIDEKLWTPPPEEEDTKGALKDFFAVVLDGVKTGRIVETKLSPHYATLERIAKARHEVEAVALNELHALLEPEQRKDLADALRQKYPSAAEKAAKEAKAPKKPPKPPAAADKAKQSDRAKRRQARVTSLLGLDELQQKRVAPVLARFETESRNKAVREAQAKRMRALAAAFEKESFDATKLDLGRGPRARMADRVAYISSLLAILKVDQRDKLARTLERPTAKRWGAAIVGDAAPIEDE